MRQRRIIFPVLAILIALGLSWWSRRETPPLGERVPAPSSGKSETRPPALAAPSGAGATPLSAAEMARDFPIAAELNAPNGNITRDLEVLDALFEAWRTNFPHDGNPVGENADIAAALAGKNPLELVLVPRAHPAFDDRGELCDRWGTPFFFHQLSGQQMEIRSAGPDRQFGTSDDAQWSPAGAP